MAPFAAAGNSGQPTLTEPVTLPLLEFLSWVDHRPRTYGDAMEAWRSSCPRLSVWEDALADGLIQLGVDGQVADRTVTLTARGQAILRGSSPR